MHNPSVPETLEGWSLLHHMFRVRWSSLRNLSPNALQELASEAAAALNTPKENGETSLVHLLGHKADLMITYFRKDFEDLARAQLQWQQTRLSDHVEMSTSYVSIVELGMYDMTSKIHQQLKSKSLEPGSEEFESSFDREMEQQRSRMMSRLFLEVPKRRYVCFYPMNKKRGESKNWYMEPYEKRSEMMLEHGMIGRNYSGKVTQIISGSIGYDDWEWGVDLYADDPLVFKKLIYEMRFDQASAVYAEFGPFYTGLQFRAEQMATFLSGQKPSLA